MGPLSATLRSWRSGSARSWIWPTSSGWRSWVPATSTSVRASSSSSRSRVKHSLSDRESAGPQLHYPSGTAHLVRSVVAAALRYLEVPGVRNPVHESVGQGDAA
ncbi:hypothetical protein C5E02_08385 [Rathayibacter rathayi]|uniref:Uncharacterized protein n=1 Tax=Rathayibacter rathayi TaxID=33887 RepID=A0ABD6WCE1_RATRA|nr:hypothetical protein C1O28_08685 [Rathayibacter rathayi]PPF16415.1 hypothetical protein C5C04_01160 [Rathayibacter rathayi]PPF52006.1 hypothetical protein C5C08_01245 [Rathayibacter rathayi]PPF83613.1 hypothetical protein C5C14_01245 [Rathayibacter rathayi]PPG16120.1 hypothetical protein C5C11_00200 [Rathayibacter rathayi]